MAQGFARSFFNPSTRIHSNIVGEQSVPLKTGSGIIYKLAMNKITGTEVRIYDGVDNTGSLIGSPQLGGVQTLEYDVAFSDGLYIETVGAGADVTVVWE